MKPVSDQPTSSPVSAAAVLAAADRIDGVAVRTPVVRSAELDRIAGAEVLVKVESLQHSGSFKLRGAYNALASLSAEQLGRGVVAYSSGNHAVALALAARMLETRATVVIPRGIVAAKVSALHQYGAEVVWYDPAQDDREAIARRLADERELELIPSFDAPDVIAGQGTVALELLQDEPALDALVAPVGGGGLLSGCAAAADGRLRLIGVEPSAAPRMSRSLAAGELVTIDPADTIADGLRVRRAGVHTFALLREAPLAMEVADDAETVAAMRFLFERLKIVAEPSGAIAVAAILAGRVRPSGRVAVVVSGGNVDAERFASLVGAA